MDSETQQNVNTLRLLCADIVQKPNSGHPGAPMGMSPAAYALWTQVMNYNPNNTEWANRDRFVLSNGHACALQYAMLHLTGYTDWTIDDLKAFRTIGSKTPGHPENHFPGIEVSTGPLGQGISNAVGLAIAEARLAAEFNRDGLNIVDHFTYVFCGDGCLQEGVSSEASSIAGHLGLGKLIVVYDDNNITIDGETHLSFTEDVIKRYEAYGWHTLVIHDGDSDVKGIVEALKTAKSVTDKPTLIKMKTTIGYGAAKQGTEGVHGNPLGAADIARLKKQWGFDPEQFYNIPESAKKAFCHRDAGAKAEAEWNALFAKYKAAHPELAAEFLRRTVGDLPEGWEKHLPSNVKPTDQVATRKLSGNALNAIESVLPELFGGSADLNPSCFTYLDKHKDFLKGQYDGRNLRFGVREHAMCAIMVGLAAHGGFIPYGSTFLNFIGYALGSVTVAALSGFRLIYVFTHDSIGVGEDGPTHQPVEKYMLCRDTPNLLFIRPADSNEVNAAYIAAIRSKHRPTVLSLSRQNLPQLPGTSIEGALKGAYIVSDAEKPDIIFVGTGSELEMAVAAKAKLTDLKVRVVSMPSWELFEEQTQEYKESVFTQGVPVLSIEAGTIAGWAKYAHASIGMTSFGTSGPGKDVYKHFGITTEEMVAKAPKVVAFYKTHPIAHLLQKPF